MDFSFFITDNKSGYKTQEKWFSKNHLDVYNNIISYSQKNNIEMSFKEKIYFFFNNINNRPKCKTCNSEIKFRERFDKPYGEFCSLKCINENKDEMIKRQKITFQKKYGVNFYPEHSDFISKQRLTKKIRYNNENYNNPIKSKNTKFEKYGDKNYCNLEQMKKTSIERYNTVNPSKNKIIIEKIKKTNNIKYGYNSPTESPIIKEKLKNTILNNIKNKFNDNSFVNYDFTNKEYKISMSLYNERFKSNINTCILCNPIGLMSISQMEINLKNEINKIYSGNILNNSRKIIRKELDIYIPEKKLALEFDGIYWHNELYVSPDYHLNKTIECQKKEIELIHIFEDEWLYKKEIIMSIIKNRLGVTEKTIFGRKCVIKEVDNNTSKKFLNENHIQGNVNSKIRIGLFYENNLISLMTFSKGRILMGGKPDEWELTRFVNVINTNVIGASSKLFKYFINTYKPNKVVSYSDIRLFNGGMYEKLGFIKKSQSKPNYWYVLNGLRYHRFNYRKSVLVKDGYDQNKTEKEIMFERKIYRIYDCGNIRWEYNF